MATLGAMPWLDSHFEASGYFVEPCGKQSKIQSKHAFLHCSEEVVSRDCSLESPRPSSRRRLQQRRSSGRGRGLVAISPLLGAAPAPGAPPELVPVDEAAANWSSFSCLMQDVMDPIEPLALSPDAAARHLPKSLIDIDDIDVQGIETDYILRKPSSHLCGELCQQFLEAGETGWDLADGLRDGVSDWGLSSFAPSWSGNVEDAWALEVALRSACWDPDSDVTAMFWDSVSWEQASCWNESCEKSTWVELEANSASWNENSHEVPKEDSKTVNSSEELLETPEKIEQQRSSRRQVVRGDEDAAAKSEEDEKQIKHGKTSDRRSAESEVVETTIMLRNIPNKYTRDMLVKQLNIEHKGLFDWIYLPIDFKNKCNVGYAFINFRSTEVCQEFVESYNGVAVRKCLPGFNSRKVVEVTPARVQGLEENVTRLRNSPVMAQLKDKPEWMPLLFDESGQPETFPEPDFPLPAVRPRSGRMKDVQK